MEMVLSFSLQVCLFCVQIEPQKIGTKFFFHFLGPPPQMGLEIYKNLPNNQAFVGIEHLQQMDEENRIAVVHFPYSDPETIPTILPLHLRNAPWNLPKDMNAFLCQLLEVRKRELFSFIPIPIVRPKVCTHHFLVWFIKGKI